MSLPCGPDDENNHEDDANSFSCQYESKTGLSAYDLNNLGKISASIAKPNPINTSECKPKFKPHLDNTLIALSQQNSNPNMNDSHYKISIGGNQSQQNNSFENYSKAQFFFGYEEAKAVFYNEQCSKIKDGKSEKSEKTLNLSNINEISPESDWCFQVITKSSYNSSVRQIPSAENFIKIANVFAEVKDYKAAGLLFRRALDLYPNCLKIYYNWGITLLKQERFEHAILKLQEGLKIDEKSTELQTLLQMAFEKKSFLEPPQNTEEGTVTAQQVVDIANDICSRKTYELAVKLLEKAIEMDSHCVKAYQSWGFFAMIRKNYSNARNLLKTALAIDPNKSDAHVMLAFTIQKELSGSRRNNRELRTKMIEQCKKALDMNLDPANKKICYFFGKFLLYGSEYEEAINVLTKANPSILIHNKIDSLKQGSETLTTSPSDSKEKFTSQYFDQNQSIKSDAKMMTEAPADWDRLLNQTLCRVYYEWSLRLMTYGSKLKGEKAKEKLDKLLEFESFYFDEALFLKDSLKILETPQQTFLPDFDYTNLKLTEEQMKVLAKNETQSREGLFIIRKAIHKEIYERYKAVMADRNDEKMKLIAQMNESQKTLPEIQKTYRRGDEGPAILNECLIKPGEISNRKNNPNGFEMHALKAFEIQAKLADSDRKNKPLYKEMVSHYKKALDIDANDPLACHFYAKLLLSEQKYEEAIEIFLKGRPIQLQEKTDLTQKGQQASIEQLFECNQSFISDCSEPNHSMTSDTDLFTTHQDWNGLINKDLLEAYYEWGFHFIEEEHDLKEAIERFDKMLEFGGHRQAYFIKGCISFAQNDINKAHSHFQQAFPYNPDFGKSKLDDEQIKEIKAQMENLHPIKQAWGFFRKGLKQAALKNFKLASRDLVDVTFKVAALYYEKGKLEKAFVKLKETHERDPNYSAALTHGLITSSLFSQET